jgi:predicted O-methyltransferase YrrM
MSSAQAPAFRTLATKTTTAGYEPSYVFPGGGDRLGDAHTRAHELVADVPGWLRPEDALKLYELAFFARGPILEIGTYRGKSGTLMAMAARDAGNASIVVTVDVDPEAGRAAARAAAERGVADRLLPFRGSAEAFFAANSAFAPALVFVDGDHSHRGASTDLRTLEARVPTGGLVLLHDYLDPKNDDPADNEIDVVRAARESWLARDAEFAGVFGACALFRRQRGGPPVPTVGIFDLLRYDSPRLQYLQRVRWPAGRAARGLLGRARGAG